MRDGASKVLVNSDRSFYSVAFSSDGMYVMAGGSDGLVGIWDVKMGQLVTWLEGHTRPVFSVSFLPDGKGLVSGSWDHTLKYWDTGLLQVDRRSRSMREDKVNQRAGDCEDPEQKGFRSLRDFRGHTVRYSHVHFLPI